MRIVRILACSMFLAAFPALGAQRTFVSAAGLDANPCSRDLPCRTFAAAMAQTAPNGEVVALDSAGYGPLTVAQSVSIVAPIGVHAGITASAGAAVTVNASTSDVVVLRNLSLNGQGATTGIAIVSAGAVQVEHCTVHGFGSNGIDVAYLAQTPSIVVSDSALRNNGNAGLYTASSNLSIVACHFSRNVTGVYITAGSASVASTVADNNSAYGFLVGEMATATFNDVVVTNNSKGIFVNGGDAVLSGGGVTNNAQIGLELSHTGGRPATSRVAAHNVEIAHNDIGVFVGITCDATIAGSILAQNRLGIQVSESSGKVRLSRTTITHNAYGLFCGMQAGAFASDGTNLIYGNYAGDNTGCPAPVVTSY